MFKPVLQTFKSSLSPWELYQKIYAFGGKSFFLDSIERKRPDQNYSYLGFNPFLEVKLENHRLEVWGAEKKSYSEKELFPVLRKLLLKYRVKGPRKYPFFTGGAVGFWGYELASLFDRVSFRKKPSAGVPQLYLGFFREVIVYDHSKKVYYLVTHDENPKSFRARKRLAFLKWLFISIPDPETNSFECQKFRPEISRSRFQSMIEQALRYIGEGDIYQANLSQRFSFDFKGSPLKLYGQLRSINPSPFASFLNLEDLKIISSSPERLVSKKGNVCETKPIAGTRPRRKSLEKELRQNPKERAEHIMLVDLERNDLGRVCEYRSVKVEELMKVEKYSHVIHLVSKITGKLRKDKDALDLLKAVFPGGTITGCPKLRCMEIIDELEPVQRGIYTGSIGYIDFYGDMDLNIVIRTLMLQKNKGHLQVGAGIVFDSNPSKEYEETLHKGEALVEALGQASL